MLNECSYNARLGALEGFMQCTTWLSWLCFPSAVACTDSSRVSQLQSCWQGSD